MNQRDYTEHVKNITEIFSQREDIPNILFDIKGPMPIINKIGLDSESLSMKKGQKIRLCYDYRTRIYEEDSIYIDKKISNGLSIGDIILVNSSNVKLKVVAFEKKPSLVTEDFKKSPFKNSVFSNSSPFLYGNKNCHEGYVKKTDFTERHREYQNTYNFDHYFDEEEAPKQIYNEDEELLIDTNNFDNYFEEKLKNKQQKTTQVYYNFIKRHLNNKEECKPSHEMDRLSSISQFNSSIISEIDPYTSQIHRKEKLRKISCLSTENSKISNKIICEVIEEGIITKNKTISILGKDIVRESEIPNISAKDIIDINKACSLGITTLSVFANSPDNLDELKEILSEEAAKKIKIFSRIETQNAIMNFDSILAKSDGIIIHHGLITSVLPLEELSLVEVYMIEKCKLQNKPVIIQNFSLKFLNVNKPFISKFSILDFAVKEGIDSIIIEEENNSLNCLFDTIRACRDVLTQVESYEDCRNKYEEMSKFFYLNKSKNMLCLTDNLFDCVARLSYEIKAGCIVTFTDDHLLLKSLSNFRPNCPIIFPTNNKCYIQFTRLFRGVIPIYMQQIEGEELMNIVINTLERAELINKGFQKVIIVNAYSNSFFNLRNSFFVIDH